MNRRLTKHPDSTGKELAVPVLFRIPAEWEDEILKELGQIEFHIRKGENLPPVVRRTILGQARSELERLCSELELKRARWEAEQAAVRA